MLIARRSWRQAFGLCLCMDGIIETFLNSAGTRKAEVFQRADGTFGFEEFKFWQEEQAWLPVGKYSIAIVDSLDHAIEEAKGRVAWLSHEA
jgi:hypothetical protein